MFSQRKLFTSFAPILVLLVTSMFFSSCSKDDKEDDSCSNFQKIDGTVDFNDETLSLSVAQLMVSSFNNLTNYGFSISAITPDCNKLLSVQFYLQIPSNSSLNGTYQVKDFFNADEGDVNGSFFTQQIEPISQSSEDLVSGTVKITSLGNKKYTIDLNAKTVANESIKLLITHSF